MIVTPTLQLHLSNTLGLDLESLDQERDNQYDSASLTCEQVDFLISQAGNATSWDPPDPWHDTSLVEPLSWAGMLTTAVSRSAADARWKGRAQREERTVS